MLWKLLSIYKNDGLIAVYATNYLLGDYLTSTSLLKVFLEKMSASNDFGHVPSAAIGMIETYNDMVNAAGNPVPTWLANRLVSSLFVLSEGVHKCKLKSLHYYNGEQIMRPALGEAAEKLQ